ncbi:hypothetical protein PVAND_000966 [Polypedilum vanderplanki]|uniref:Uncharacterized protein n=1 Tax=Polypedilum vanderplanki TaxID=319348 RepID=A0A9J6BLS6_POLVA|nr:hypothetical protein PVAND_000966 [Polypedilum vanderplanki]
MNMANSSNSGNAIRDDGKPRLNRNQRRMNDFNNRRAGRDWNDMMSVEEKENEALKKNESKQNNAKFYTQRKERKKQQQSGKPDKPRQMAPEDMLGQTVTPTVDEQLWDEGGYCGTHPVQNVYAQNVDFSTFNAVLEVSYAQMEVVNPRLRREMPFCLYQHAMTEALHIYMIKQAKGENMDLEFMNDGPPVNILPDDFVMPLMVSEYIRTVATRVNATGDEIRVNYPVAGRPQVRDGDVHSGFFGVCDQDSHNAYECYPSPAVSMELINRTAEANRHPNREGAFGAWHPLPAVLRPNNALCTPNLLGYRIPERLTPEGLTKCENLVFANGNTLAARVCDCPQVTILVSNTLRKLEKDIKMTNEFLISQASV